MNKQDRQILKKSFRSIESTFKHFNRNGNRCTKCRWARSGIFSELNNKKGGSCCQNCAEYFGHFYKIDEYPEKLDDLAIKYNFDDKMGFLIDGGCRLPIYKRSTTCLGYCCISKYKRITHHAKETIGQIRTKYGELV